MTQVGLEPCSLAPALSGHHSDLPWLSPRFRRSRPGGLSPSCPCGAGVLASHSRALAAGRGCPSPPGHNPEGLAGLQGQAAQRQQGWGRGHVHRVSTRPLQPLSHSWGSSIPATPSCPCSHPLGNPCGKPMPSAWVLGSGASWDEAWGALPLPRGRPFCPGGLPAPWPGIAQPGP